ncbi:MAG: toxin-antitoxin system HicB family antitoxin [Betaproteobacteria bacterium]
MPRLSDYPFEIRLPASDEGGGVLISSRKLSVPLPHSGGVASGSFVARVPKTVHAQLAIRARSEGVSLNAFLLIFIAQGLGGPSGPARSKRPSPKAHRAA